MEASPMPSNRRSQVRSRTNVETQWACITGTASKGSVLIRDISRAGACVEVDHPVAPGERVRIRLLTVMEARVVHVQETAEGKWLAGCQFDRELSEEEIRLLVRE
jgi:PilZ domain